MSLVPATGGQASLSFEMIVTACVKLFSKYPKEVLLVGLVDVIPQLSEPLIAHAIATQWRLLSQQEQRDLNGERTDRSMKLIDLYIQWTSALSVFEISGEEKSSRVPVSVIDWETVKLHAGFQEIEPKAIVQTAYAELNHLIEKYSLPQLRRYLLNEWNVKAADDTRQVTRLMSALQVTAPPSPDLSWPHSISVWIRGSMTQRPISSSLMSQSYQSSPLPSPHGRQPLTG
jgi:hypothetical protein